MMSTAERHGKFVAHLAPERASSMAASVPEIVEDGVTGRIVSRAARLGSESDPRPF
jgi:hypothetical protein